MLWNHKKPVGSQAFYHVRDIGIAYKILERFNPAYPPIQSSEVQSSHIAGLVLPVLGTWSYSADGADAEPVVSELDGGTGVGCEADADGVLLYFSSGVDKSPLKREKEPASK